jgi:hypothetical protein
MQWKGIGAVFGNASGFAAVSVILIGIFSRNVTWKGGMAAALLLSIALLFKETTLTYSLFLVCIFLIHPLLDRSQSRRLLVPSILPPVVFSGVFVILRQLLGAPLTLADSSHAATAARYQIGGISHWLENEARLLLATATPISTPLWFRTEGGGIALFLLLTLLFNALLVFGLLKLKLRIDRPTRLLFGWSLIGLACGGVPVSLMKHVSEAYASPLIIWYSVLIGLAWQGWMSHGRKRLAATLFGLFFVLHIASSAHKVFEMVRAGGTEMRLIESIGVTLRDIPSGAKIAIEVAPEVERPYSFYDVHPEYPIAYAFMRGTPQVEPVSSSETADYVLYVSREGYASIRN